MIELSMISRNYTEKVICVGIDEPTNHYVIHVEDDKLSVRSSEHKPSNNKVVGISQDTEVKFIVEFGEDGLVDKVVLKKENPTMVIVYE